MTTYTFPTASQAAVVPVLTGASWSIYRVPSADLDERYTNTRYLPAMPLIAYAKDVLSQAQVEAANVPQGGAFLVSATFQSAPADPFTISGASPNAVGYYKDPTLGRDLGFRSPRPYEAVFFVGDMELYWYYQDPITKVWSWTIYRSLAQRHFDNLGAFTVFDPDGIFNYVGQIIGGSYNSFTYDSHTLLNIRDPDHVPESLIYLAARNIGAGFADSLLVVNDPARETVAHRYTLATAPHVNRTLGQAESVSTRLQVLGFTGGVTERWLQLNRPLAWLVADSYGSAQNVPIVGTSTLGMWGMRGGDAVQYSTGLFYATNQPILAGHYITISDGTTTVTFTFVASGATGSQVNIGVDNAATMANFIAVFNASALAITASATLPPPYQFDLPSGFNIAPPGPYWLSNFLTIHVNSQDGTPWLPELADRIVLQTRIEDALVADVIPINGRIVEFATDVNVTSPLGAADSSADQLGLVESVTVT